MLIEQYRVIYLWFLYLHQKIAKSCDKFEQVNTGSLKVYVFSCRDESIWNERHEFWICD